MRDKEYEDYCEDEGPIEIPVRDGRERDSWFGKIIVSNLVTLLIAGVVFSNGYGRLSNMIETQQHEVQMLRTMNITPGAQTAIGVMQAQDRALEQRVTNIEQEMRSQRLELVSFLQRFETKLDDHIYSAAGAEERRRARAQHIQPELAP